MFQHILFLSHGMQLFMFLLLVGLILVFMRIASQEHRINQLEKERKHYMSHEDYLETFNVLWDEKMEGKDVGAYPPDDSFYQQDEEDVHAHQTVASSSTTLESEV